MNRDRAIYHLEALATACATMALAPGHIFGLQVVELWVFGDLLDIDAAPDVVSVALGLDRPAEDMPWLGEPSGARHWADATRMSRNPISPCWRSTHAPIWNHRIERPVLVWDIPVGSRAEVFAALRAGSAESCRPPAPPAAELRERLLAEQVVALDALRASAATYGDHRWRPGKLTPYADTLHAAAAGYLDLTDALTS